MPAPSSSAAIEVDGLGKEYGDVVALAGLSLRVERGSVFGFLGANGAGKTTAVKVLLGLVRPTYGGGTVLGAPLGDVRARKKVGYLPELFRYPEWLAAREVLGLHAKLAGVDRARRAAEIDRVLAATGIAARAGDRVATFSKGMQQRLGIAVALLGEPAAVFLDEPTSALDPIGRHDVRELIRGLRERGTTVFLNSHLLTEVEQVCDRVAIVRAGRVVADGPLAEIAGAQLGVRVRADANGVPLLQTLAAFGTVSAEEGGAFVGGVAHERVPDVVAALVAAGARVYGVEPVSRTLEERFLEEAGGR